MGGRCKENVIVGDTWLGYPGDRQTHCGHTERERERERFVCFCSMLCDRRAVVLSGGSVFAVSAMPSIPGNAKETAILICDIS